MRGNLLAIGSVKYLKSDASKIAKDIVPHEEMCYLIEDGITEINSNKK